MSYTELTFACRLVETLNKIIHQEKLPFDRADAEIDLDGGRADIILWALRKIKPALLVEIKRPESELQDIFIEVKDKAQRSGIPYFVLWNVSHFRLWKTPYFEERCTFYESVYSKDVVKRNIDFEVAIDDYENDIEDFLRQFLMEFKNIYYG